LIHLKIPKLISGLLSGLLLVSTPVLAEDATLVGVDAVRTEPLNQTVPVIGRLIADHGVYRHDFVASTVMDATMKLQMETGVPIIYGILTPQEFMSEGRAEFFNEHFIKKGKEAAMSVLTTLDNERLLAGLHKQTG